MSRSALVAAVVFSMLVAACSAVPGASPTLQVTPTPTPTDTATPSAPPTASPAPTDTPAVNPTPQPTSCDPYYGDCDPTSPPSSPQGSTTVSSITYGEVGAYLAGPTRMALYTFDNDSPGASSCSGDCAVNWPPLTIAMGETPRAAPGVSGELDTIERDDGTYQVTYNGAPLYYFVGDQELYDVTGDGVNGVWHLARP